ncbi:MAG: deoxyribose-phosphate aldolase [Oscillospiraceae bacterium]
MEIKEILPFVDHTLLAQTASINQIKQICDEAIKYKTASICIPPFYVDYAKKYVSDKIKICTVIGFPNGYNTTAVKVFETQDAIKNGADEIDMVINIGLLKDKKYDEIFDEIVKIKTACGDKILKVIIETCLLSQDEKIKMCEIITKAKADFIKTSTGFSTGGATFDDVKLFKKYVGDNVKIKAAGSISSKEDAQQFLNLGCQRLGTSKIVKLAKNQ